MPQKIKPFLMFEGQCEEAMNFYVSLFADAAVTDIRRYGKEGPGAEGSVMQAAFDIQGQSFMCIDSPVEIDALFAKLSDGGKVLMPLNQYPFARKFAWVADRFGVSWQLRLAN